MYCTRFDGASRRGTETRIRVRYTARKDMLLSSFVTISDLNDQRFEPFLCSVNSTQYRSRSSTNPIISQQIIRGYLVECPRRNQSRVVLQLC